MRQSRKDRPRRDRPLVGIVVDGVTGYGREVMRGIMRYAHVDRRWLFHEELRRGLSGPLENWPDCDAAILAGTAESVLEFVLKRCRHVVRCSGSADPRVTPVASLDDYAVGKMAAEHLINCRLEHFGFYGLVPNSMVTVNRFEGFRDRLKGEGFTCDEAGLGWPTRPEAGQAHWPTLLRWLERLPKPVGIMAVDDVAGHDLAAACMEAQIPVPDRIAIIGVNNDDLLCDSAWPPLSSVEGDYSRVGYLAAGMLDRMLKGEKLVGAEREVRLAPLGVVRRLSTDVLAVNDPSVAAAARFIREHACDPCDVSDVLRHVPVGRRWLERQFHSKLGRTPHDEIVRVRIEASKRLLLETELTLPDIAARCGFAVVQNFGRAFLKATGTTPGSFRRAARQGAA